MSNLAIKQRNHARRCLCEIRKFMETATAPADLIKGLGDLEEELEKNRWGLMFEEHQEDSEITGKHPGFDLVELPELRIESGLRDNWLIEGENLEVLKRLVETLQNRIDVICIDPPYNTGMRNLIYNDHDFNDEKDMYSHSKWLSFMNKRLVMARLLLTETGVLFIHIDENEIGTLLLLCEQLFGENNADILIWPKTDQRFDQNRVEKPFHNIKMVHEYVIVAFQDKANTQFNKIITPVYMNGVWQDQSSDLESIVKSLGTTSSAKDEVGRVFGDRCRFQTPKPMRLIKEFIRAASKKDSLILDFFAGSGTTGHAVMDLNKEDNGERKYILINKGENGITRDITYERLKAAICDQGYEENLRYFVSEKRHNVCTA